MTTETVLTEEQIMGIGVPIEQSGGTLREFARAIEQAVLQSERVQAWKRDAERYREIRSRLTGASYDPRYFENPFIAGCMGHSDFVDSGVDSAMEERT